MVSQIRGTVTGQALALEQDLIVADTNDFLSATFEFDSVWDGLSIWVHFTKGETSGELPVHHGRVERTQHLNLGSGTWEVYLHGRAENGILITTEPRDLRVKRTGVLKGVPLPEIPPSVAESVDLKAQKALENSEEALKEAQKTGTFADAAAESASEAARSAEAAERAESAAGTSASNAEANAQEAKRQADQALSNKLSGIYQHNQDPASHPHLLAEVSRVESIAKGRNFGVVFDTKDQMESWLAMPENVKTLEVGTNLYIRALNVPDYWWDGTQAQVLEVEHPDLTQYVTKTQLSMELPAVVTQEEYDRLQAAGQLVPGRIYYIDLTRGGV